MIENFENITFELTEFEKSLVPVLIESFKTRKKRNPIKEPEIIAAVNKWIVDKGITERDKFKKLTGVRLRKIVNQIRVHSLLPLIATQNGYFVSYEFEVISSQIRSLQQRAAGIIDAAEGLTKFRDNFFGCPD